MRLSLKLPESLSNHILQDLLFLQMSLAPTITCLHSFDAGGVHFVMLGAYVACNSFFFHSTPVRLKARLGLEDFIGISLSVCHIVNIGAQYA